MVYRASKRRPIRRRRAIKRKVPTNKALDRKIRRVERKVEVKYNDAYTPAVSVVTTGTALSGVTQLAQGTGDEDQRIGDEVYATSYSVRFTMFPGTSIVAEHQLRCMIVIDQMPQGLTLTTSNLASINTANVLSVLDITTVPNLLIAPRQMSGYQRFKVIHDKIYILHTYFPAIQSITNNTSATATQSVSALYDTQRVVYITKKINRKIKYMIDGAGTNIPAKNSIYTLFFSDGGSTPNNPQIVAAERLMYKDS
jgi:hypothetical protein